ncbi:MAG: cupin [Myxococcales bacterium]|nr:cupin [Myxococcales bacterium]
MRHPQIINVDEVEAKETDHVGAYGARRRQLGAAVGGRQLGCSWMELEPGMSAWPLHYHAANEECLFILSGEGTLQLGERRCPVRAGDYVALPVGPGHAHKLTNTGEQELRYLCLSTMHPVDLTIYPDSDKVGVFGGAAPGGDREERFVSGYFRAEGAVPYWDGESS